MKERIGRRVAELRDKAGKKQGEIAALLGVDVRTYRTREQGNYFFPVPELVSLAEIFGVTLDFLLTGEDRSAGVLSQEEERLLRGWRKIGNADKVFILGIINDALLDLAEKD